MNRASEPLVSVVTPFYNTAPYLAECIESVLNQSYQNFEYILVDNQSTDGSAEIGARYAQQEPRIRYVRTARFLSQLQNYNFSFENICSGSLYCKMVQSDDWIFPRCLTEMVTLALAHPTAGMVSSYRLVETDVQGTGLPVTVSALSGRDAGRLHLMTPTFLFGSPTTVLYRSDLVRARKPFYEEDRFHADTELAYALLLEHDFCFVHQVLSFTRRQEGSITWQARATAPAALDRMIVTRRYGPRYLSPAEYEACLSTAEDWFYAGLGREWLRAGLRSRDQTFWDRQLRGLKDVGDTIRLKPLVRGVIGVLAEELLCPLRTLKRARRALAYNAK